MTLNLATIKNGLLQLAGLAAIVVASIPAASVPIGYRPGLAIAGAVVYAIERWASPGTPVSAAASVPAGPPPPA